MTKEGYDGEYEELLLLLSREGLHVSPAHLHGRMCGYLAVGMDVGVGEWLDTLARDLAATAPLEGEIAEVILRLLARSGQELARREFSFQLLLPDDDAPMSERAREIGQWCDGFVESLRALGDELVRAASDEAVEQIRDLERIAEISDESDEGEEPEMDFLELTEYVRLAAMDLFDEFNSE